MKTTNGVCFFLSCAKRVLTLKLLQKALPEFFGLMLTDIWALDLGYASYSLSHRTGS